MARPTKYSPKFTAALLAYFSKPPYRRNKKTGQVLAADLPTLAGFACSIGVCRDTLHAWASAANERGELQYPEFSDAYKRAKDFQENFLVVNTAHGLIPPAFGIFSLKNVAGWRDKHPGEAPDVQITNSVSNLTDEQLDARLAAKLKGLGIKSGEENG
ncbi:MAG: hypothetical protein HC883_00035 [Bdellovibrionaceae bacterium]|nr:hypothetical protein [Pseudobdellovibrionaceae bacterium]